MPRNQIRAELAQRRHIERTRAWMDARQNWGLTPVAQLQISVVIYGSGIVEGYTKRQQPRDV
jgi:hypothetical protein